MNPPRQTPSAKTDIAALREAAHHGTPAFPLQVYTGYADSMQREVLHWHEEMEIIWMPAPGGRITVNGKVHETQRDSVFFIHPGEIHSWDSRGRGSENAAAIVFHWRLLDLVGGAVREKYLQPIALGAMRLPRSVTPMKPWEATIASEVKGLVKAVAGKSPAYELTAVAHLYRILAELAMAGSMHASNLQDAQRASFKIARIKLAMEYVFAHYQDKLTVAQLANVSGLSTYHFSRQFKKITNQTPVSFINRYRVERATELLKDPKRGILETSMDVGFSHLSYFNKIFKRLQGCTPSKYRDSIRH